MPATLPLDGKALQAYPRIRAVIRYWHRLLWEDPARANCFRARIAQQQQATSSRTTRSLELHACGVPSGKQLNLENECTSVI